MKKIILFSFSALLLLGVLSSGTVPQQERRREQQWVDSVMNTLTLRQRIAQLFVAPVEIIPEKQPNTDRLIEYIKKEQLGGVIVMKAWPSLYAKNINTLQQAANVPLLVSIDGEWGVAMRMDSVMPFPRQMMLGAISDNKLIERMGEAVAGQCSRIGVQMNYAPVVDVNNNPNNPVINTRSFGENKYNVAEKSIAYMHGLQNKGVLSCAKHFPGHGDTYQDSHEVLPSICHSPTRLDSLELYPFRALMEAGIDAVMVAHLQVPAYDSVKRPSTLSHNIVSMLLKDELEFSGLIVTDALNMKAITLNCKRDSLAYAAILAGNDVMLMPDSISVSINRIEKAVTDGKLSVHKINTKCRKVLAAKYRAGLNNYRPVVSTNLLGDLNNANDEALRYELTEKALTLLINKDSLLPLQHLDTLKIAYLEIGKNYGKDFREQLSFYGAFDSFSIEPKAPKDTLKSLRKKLDNYNLIIAGWHNTDARPQYNFGVDTVTAQFITNLALQKKVVLNFFGTPYGIKKFKDYKNLAGLIVSYENSKYSQQRSAQLIFGGVAAQGTLPVSIDNTLSFGNGIRQVQATRLHYVIPEEIGIAQGRLKGIDSLIESAIKQHATPGAQMVAIYKGNVFYNKAFGKQTYDNKASAVTINDIYDWASLTKISATLPVVMKLYNSGTLQLNNTLSDYLPELASTNKKNLEISDILTHSAGLKAFQAFQTSFFEPDEKTIDTAYFSRTPSAKFPLQVTDKLYASEEVAHFIYRQIDASALQSKTYRYSDWGFIYMQRIVESITGRPLDRLADSLFYAPLGMNNTEYLPLKRIAKTRIPPTEKDSLYRKQTIQGTVNDPTASLLGGVAGHAGVFGNANDLAKLLQLYLNGGTYGGERYFADSTVNKFTECAACKKGNRRGLGFDKPEPDADKDSPIGREWSLASYGHSGYVGNLCWVDPERDLIVIFLSNRSYPNDDKKLNKLNIRSKIFSEFVRIVDEVKAPAK